MAADLIEIKDTVACSGGSINHQPMDGWMAWIN
jgi:hypothetical protein